MRERVFISYKRVNQIKVFEIKDNIEAAVKEKCWIDQQDIPSDAKWDTEIKKAIENCDVFVFIFSAEHNKITNLLDDWTYKEIKYATELGKHIEILKIDDAPLPKWLKEFIPSIEIIHSNNSEKLNALFVNIADFLGLADEKKINAMPDGVFKVDDMYFRATEDRRYVEITRVPDERYSGAIDIPDSIVYNGYEYIVTRIGDCAFDCCKNLMKVIIPKTINHIGNQAFMNCRFLTELEIPDSVSYIGVGAFCGCSSIESIFIPDTVTTIERSAFYGCTSLKSIHLPNKLTILYDGLLSECTSLKSLRIPASIEYIFHDFCDEVILESIVVEEGNQRYDSRDNCNAIIETETQTLIKGSTNMTLPQGIRIIGECALRNLPFFDIDIPEGVIEIKDNALCNCQNLLSITLPSSLKNIGHFAFAHCTSLLMIDIPEGVISIGNTIFAGCKSLVSITLPKTLVTIFSYSYKCQNILGECKSLEYISVAEGNENYDSRNGCNALIETATDTMLTGCPKTIIPDSVSCIGEYAFNSYKYLLEDIRIPEGVSRICKGAFDISGTRYITLPDSIEDIEADAFCNPSIISLIQVNIPRGSKERFMAMQGMEIFGDRLEEYDRG